MGCPKQTEGDPRQRIAEPQVQASQSPPALHCMGSKASTAKSPSLASLLHSRQPLQQGRAEARSPRSGPSCGTSHCSKEPGLQNRSMPQSLTSLQPEGFCSRLHTANPAPDGCHVHHTAAAPHAGLHQHVQQHIVISRQVQQVLRESWMPAFPDCACSTVLAPAAASLRRPTHVTPTPPTLSSRAHMATFSTRLSDPADGCGRSREHLLGVRRACSMLVQCDHDQLRSPAPDVHTSYCRTLVQHWCPAADQADKSHVS